MIVNECKLDIRYNISQKCVELRTNQTTTNIEMIEKANLMINAFAKGFDLKDAKAFLTIE
jgi:rRNA processing protein Krr1/Pno1